MKVKHSISVVLTAISLAGMLVLALAVSTIFVIRMQAITSSQIESLIKEQTSGIASNITLTLSSYETALHQTAAGINFLHETAGIDALSGASLPQEEMRGFLNRIRDNMQNVAQVFMANNTPTYEPGGYAVFAPLWQFGGDYDQRTRPWYTGAKEKAGEVSYTDPYMALATGIFSTSLSTIIYDNQQNDLGVLVLDIAVSSLTDMVNSATNTDGMESWLLNKDGIYISNDDPEKVMKINFFEDQAGLSQYRDGILSDISFYAMGGEYIVSSSPIPGADWFVVSTVPRNIVFAELNQAIITTAILAAVLALVILVILIITIRGIAKPIGNIANILKDISEGEGDLTRQINVTANNEIGDMAHYFNETMFKIKNLIRVIKQKAATLSEIGTDLSSNMAETASAINQITANIQSIKGRVINQSASVTETNATMEQITINIDKLSGHVERQTESVAQSSSAIEEMLANIQSVTQTLIKNAENVSGLTEASDVGRTGLQDVAQDIQEIARESEGLLEINAVMENIASQTNLLAMNAAIEAAHAGEAGKGFAVVSDEIRKLAESSSEQSKTISTVLKKIKTSIDKITASTNNVLQKFEAIDNGVKIVAEQEENIRNAMEEQGQGSKQILEATSRVNEVTLQVKGGSSQMLEGSNEVIRESKNLEKVTQEITGGMNEMSSGADQINVAVSHVNEISIKNRENIELLIQEVSRFKVE